MNAEEKPMTKEEIDAILDELIPEPVKSESPFAEKENLHKGHRKRVREKFWDLGGENMKDIDLLEMLLFYANVRKDTYPLAKRLYEKFGNIENVFYADVSELSPIVEVGESVYTLLAVIRLLNERFSAPIREQVCFTDWQFLRDYLITQFRGFDKERLFFFALDSCGHLLAKKMKMSKVYGAVNFTFDEVYDFLKEHDAVALIMAHNHPNGIVVPSPADLDSTRQMYYYLNENGIALVEHYVVAGDRIAAIVAQLGERNLLKLNDLKLRDYLRLN